MRKNPVRLAVTAFAVLVFGATPALGQMNAGERPDTRGPLVFDDKACARDVDKTTSGRRAVVTRGCSFTYDLRRGQDNSNSRDYGVFWFQTTVDPEGGFCLTNVETTIKVPRGYRIESHTPKKKRTSTSDRTRSRLIVRGGGNAQLAVIKNSYTMHPRVLDPARDGREFTVEWRGATHKKFALAMGIEVSYPQGDPPNKSASAFAASELRPSC